jgi:hypothetical protein
MAATSSQHKKNIKIGGKSINGEHLEGPTLDAIVNEIKCKIKALIDTGSKYVMITLNLNPLSI